MEQAPVSSPVEGRGRAGQTYRTSGAVPRGLYEPADQAAVRLWLSTQDGPAEGPGAAYCALAGKELERAEAQLDLLARCHSALRLRESSLHHAAYLYHRLLARLGPGDAGLPRLLGALLFVCNKYEPTDRRVYPLAELIRRLFGARTGVTAQSLLEAERTVLGLLDYRLEPHTPYQAVHLYGAAAGLDARDMHLALYLVTAAAMSPALQAQAPADVAAAAVIRALERARLPWPPSLAYWTARTPADLRAPRAALLAAWQRLRRAQLEGRPRFVSVRYADDHHYRAARRVT